MVKCWDLEYNKVVRHYHGHLSGVFALSLHPILDLLISGGRDSVARVWDMRTKNQVHVLGGHVSTVSSILTAGVDPQVRVCWQGMRYLLLVMSYYVPFMHDVSGAFRSCQHDGHALHIVDMCQLPFSYSFFLHPFPLPTHSFSTPPFVLIFPQPPHPLPSSSSSLTLLLLHQVITGSYDTTIKLFDLAAGKCMSTLTHHKKSVRALASNPRELSFVSAGADNMKKW